MHHLRDILSTKEYFTKTRKYMYFLNRGIQNSSKKAIQDLGSMF